MSSGAKRNTAHDILTIFGQGAQASQRASHEQHDVEGISQKSSILSSSTGKAEEDPFQHRKLPRKVTFAPTEPGITSGYSTNSHKLATQVSSAESKTVSSSSEHYTKPHVKAEYKITIGHNSLLLARRTTSHPFYRDHYRVLLWDISGEEKENDCRVQMTKLIQDDHFVTPIAAYKGGKGITIAYELMAVSLLEVAICGDFEEPELVIILRQVVDGLKYLEQRGIGHPKLSCGNVFMNTSGRVKIGSQHFCSVGGTDNLVTGLYKILETLLTGHENENFKENIQSTRWGDPQLYEFIDIVGRLESDKTSDLTPCAKLEKVAQHPFLKLDHEQLVTDGFAVPILWRLRWLTEDVDTISEELSERTLC